MNRLRNLSVVFTTFYFLLTYVILEPEAVAWENQLTHPVITKKSCGTFYIG